MHHENFKIGQEFLGFQEFEWKIELRQQLFFLFAPLMGSLVRNQ